MLLILTITILISIVSKTVRKGPHDHRLRVAG